MTDGTPAETALEAHLEPERVGAAKAALRSIAAVALAAVGAAGEDIATGYDLVVKRLDSGVEVMRTRAGQAEEASRLLDTVHKDLAAQDVETFIRDWRVVDEH